MEIEDIMIANLKCSGCANTITTKMAALQGMQSVIVNHDTDTVTVNYDFPLTRDTITSTLHSIGYPEATAENGLLTQLKSYASCLIGRLNK